MGLGTGRFRQRRDRDLFIANGHSWTISIYDTTGYRVRNVVLKNDEDGRLWTCPSDAETGVGRKQPGVGFDDLDNDGDVDVVVLNARSRPTIPEHRSRVSTGWQTVSAGSGANGTAWGPHGELPLATWSWWPRCTLDAATRATTERNCTLACGSSRGGPGRDPLDGRRSGCFHQLGRRPADGPDRRNVGQRVVNVPPPRPDNCDHDAYRIGVALLVFGLASFEK